ncbi:MAG: 3-hydroxyanthranilate 3,4-dioxygenase [Gammaproteobacteria bacterium]|nr:3-hydroxyanthranilate 3,4-dioxygenase [Gammaproteobacteria bacterium]
MNAMNVLNFQNWIDDNRHLLKPPVGNKVVYPDGDFIVMVVGGPNTRSDYHWEEGPEFFYQLEGEMVLKTMQDGKPVDYPIKAGEIFLLPPKVPHSPQRMENSVGLVIERKRTEGEKDGLMWFCDKCHNLLYEEYFPLKDIEKDFHAVFENYFGDEAKRTCDKCGEVMPDLRKK